MNDLASRAQMAGHPSAPTQSTQPGNKKKSKLNPMNIVSGILLICVTILVVALLAFIVFGGGKSESQLIQSDKYQAIFLSDQSGQVYFGKLSVLNSRQYKLTDIYYVRVDNAVQPDRGTTAAQNISLAKLGNELHGPDDVMYISRDHVLFWENLKDDGQVVKAINEYKKNGGSTSNTNSSSNASTNNNSSTNTNTNQ